MYSPISWQHVFFQSLSIKVDKQERSFYMKSLDGLAEALKRVSYEKDSKASTAPKGVSMYGKHLFGGYSRHE